MNNPENSEARNPAKLALLFKDLRSTNMCCPSVYDVDALSVQGISGLEPREEGYVFVGSKIEEDSKFSIPDVAPYEECVYVPTDVVDRCALREEILADWFLCARSNHATRYEMLSRAYMAPLADSLARDVAAFDPNDVVDFACGAGFLIRSLIAQGIEPSRIIGVDIDAVMLSAASEGPSSRFFLGDAGSTGFSDSSCDVVTCHHGFQYFDSPDRVAREALRILRPGGHLVASVWTSYEANCFLQAQLDLLRHFASADVLAKIKSSTIERLGGQEGIRKLLLDSGFSDVEVRRWIVMLPTVDAASYFELISQSATWSKLFDALPKSTKSRIEDDFITEWSRRWSEETVAVEQIVIQAQAAL